MNETTTQLIFKLAQMRALLHKSKNIIIDIQMELNLPTAVYENLHSQFNGLIKFADQTGKELLLIHSELFKSKQINLEYIKRGVPNENKTDKTGTE